MQVSIVPSVNVGPSCVISSGNRHISFSTYTSLLKHALEGIFQSIPCDKIRIIKLQLTVFFVDDRLCQNNGISYKPQHIRALCVARRLME